MSGRRDYKQRLFAALSALAILCVFSSCAGSTPDATKLGDGNSDAAALLDDSKPEATDVKDTSAFSDLEKAKDTQSTASDAAAPAPADGDTFYKTMGGETLRRVAYTLYSDKSFAKQLAEKNPDLKGSKKLGADQKVFFDMATARPDPRFLTKDLLDRYAQPLAERLQAAEKAKGLPTTTATLGRGESLQNLSQRLYGTHRYWAEIYLVNQDKIRNYDRVPAGLTLSVVDRPSNGVAKAEAPATAAVLAEVEERKVEAPRPAKVIHPVPVVAPVAPVAAVMPTQPLAPVIQPSPPPKDPIPEIPPVVQKAPPPPAPVVKPKPIAAVAVDTVDSGSSSNSSFRRILYVALILLLGGAAYYFTRTPRRPKVDMLDMNADVIARPKLAPKDSQNTNLG